MERAGPQGSADAGRDPEWRSPPQAHRKAVAELGGITLRNEGSSTSELTFNAALDASDDPDLSSFAQYTAIGVAVAVIGEHSFISPGRRADTEIIAQFRRFDSFGARGAGPSSQNMPWADECHATRRF